MSVSAILRALLPSFAPLIAFVAAEAIFGEAIGLLFGLGLGLAELLYILWKEKRFDPFAAADTGLLALAGALSLLLENELFFKMKPAVVELVFAGALGLLIALPEEYLRRYFERQVKGVRIEGAALPSLRRNLALMIALLGFHAGLTVWAALELSTAAWGFVSGGLLYIMFGLFALVGWIRARRLAGLPLFGRGPMAGDALRGGNQGGASRNGGRKTVDSGGSRTQGPLVPIVDEEGKVLGCAPLDECRQNPGTLYPLLRVHLDNGEGGFYMRRRLGSGLPRGDSPASASKGGNGGAGLTATEGVESAAGEGGGISPGAWDCAVSTPIFAGEDLEAAMRRALRENLGVSNFALEASGEAPRAVLRHRYDSERESVLAFVYLLTRRAAVATPDATLEGRYWSANEVRAAYQKHELTAIFEREYALLAKAAASAAETLSMASAASAARSATSSAASSASAAGSVSATAKKANKRK